MAVISIVRRKGGAGNTTLAVQLGLAWLATGKRIAMLDIDPQGGDQPWQSAGLRRLDRRGPGRGGDRIGEPRRPRDCCAGTGAPGPT